MQENVTIMRYNFEYTHMYKYIMYMSEKQSKFNVTNIAEVDTYQLMNISLKYIFQNWTFTVSKQIIRTILYILYN